MESCRRCTEASSPTIMASHFFLLANFISGSSLNSLLLPVDVDTSDSSCLLSKLVIFLTADEQVNCSAFASKAGLLECANAVCTVLDELVSRFVTALNTAGEDSQTMVYQTISMKVSYFIILSHVYLSQVSQSLKNC